MLAHELAAELLKCENLPVSASVDISTCEDDYRGGRNIFTTDMMGVNAYEGDAGEITLLFAADPEDSHGNKF